MADGAIADGKKSTTARIKNTTTIAIGAVVTNGAVEENDCSPTKDTAAIASTGIVGSVIANGAVTDFQQGVTVRGLYKDTAAVRRAITANRAVVHVNRTKRDTESSPILGCLVIIDSTVV